MPRITIQQFRALLASRADASTAVHVYRELTRRPEIAGGMLRGEWAVWAPASQVARA